MSPKIPGILVAIVATSAVAAAQSPNPRLRIRFDDGWRFRRDPEQKGYGGPGPFTWRIRLAPEVRSLNVSVPPDDLDSDAWKPSRVADSTLSDRQRFAWYATDLGSAPGDEAKHLHFESVDDNAVVFLNGVRLARHIGYGAPFDVDVKSVWRSQGPNRLVVLIENTGGAGGINGPVTLDAPIRPEVDVPGEARPAFDDHAWRTLHLPHDYVVEGVFRPDQDPSHGSLPRATAWYRKSFAAPASYRGKSVWIDFDGVYRNSAVYLNGHLLGREPSGYIGFRFDVSRFLNYGGRNVLAVRVDPRRDEGWWYEGAGIYRHVWLNVAAPAHVEPDGVFVRSEVEDPAGAATSPATLRATTSVVLPAGDGYRLRTRVIDPEGKTVATKLVPIAREVISPAPKSLVVTSRIDLPSAFLWSIENPRLYRLVTTVVRNGQTLDRVETPFGIRTIRFDKDRGFFLNGKAVKLKGTCNHQDHAGVGIAMPDGLLDWRIRRLKEMGSNAYRCSHNPPAKELLDACDRLGMIVMDETRHLGDSTLPKSPTGTTADDLSELRRLVLRDRNHPSVVMWSLFNEEPLQGSAEGAELFVKMRKLVHQLDPTRPATGAANFGYEHGIVDVADLFGFNYNIRMYDDVRRRRPDLPLFGSETASTVSTRGEYVNDPVKGYVSAYDVNHPSWAETAENAWRPIAERPWMAGGFVWTGFDYKGEPTPYAWPCINSHFGILDICGFPKDNFYYYKAWWGDEPVAHILPHWNWPGKQGQPISVWVHSNADQVELLLNGRSLGRKTMPRYGHLEWSVPYKPGRLQARGYRNGRLIVTDTVETTGAPVAIRLKTTRPSIHADLEDLSPIEVEVIDAEGRVVPDASNLISFKVNGATVVGVGNGDPSSHEPDKATQRRAFHGLCMALIGATSKPGPILITATSPTLKPATLAIQSR